MMKLIVKYKDRIWLVLSAILNWGIPLKVQDSLSNGTWISKATMRYQLFRKIFPIKVNVFLTYPVSRFCRLNVDKLVSQWLNLFTNRTDEERMLLIVFAYMCGIFDEEICRMILEYAKTTKNENYRYWITQNISKMCFYTQKGVFNSYYTDRKQLMAQVAKEMYLNIPSKVENGTNHLCIVTYLLNDSIYNSVLRVTKMLENNLRKYYSRIMIISIESFGVGVNDGHEFGQLISYPRSSSMRKGIQKHFDQQTIIHFANGKNYKDRFQDSLNAIYEFCPTLIIDITDEFSPISYYYASDFKTVYLPLRLTPSSSFFQKLIMGVRDYERIYKLFTSDTECDIIDWQFPEFIPLESQPYSRNELGFSPEDFIIITIGSCSRICDAEFCTSIVRMLRDNDSMVWLIVGDRAPDSIHDNYPELFSNKRIVERDFEKRLRSLCEICDVLLRLNTTGGSGATAIAAMSGLPIAMTSFPCDAERWLGSDYSNLSSAEEVCRYIEKLSKDKELYDKEREQTMELISRAVDSEEKWRELYGLLCKL